METKINLVEILKDKPQGTKLYSSACGKCKLEEVDDKSFKISFYNSKFGFMNGGEGHLDKNGKLYDDGECVVFPSKEMRDWSKFAWKKGDVLISNDGKKEVFFNGFTDDTYALFKAKHGFEVLSNGKDIYLADEDGIATSDYTLEDKDVTQTYINTIEERLGGKLNRETLEVEKAQQEFKNGDIVTIMPRIGDKLIYLFKAEDNEKYYGHAFFDGNIAIVNEDSYCQKDFSTARPSTEEEKQQLFEALAKKGKAWDAEKKEVADIKKELQFKPFEKVLVRDSYDDMWRASFFSHIKEDDGRYVTTCFTWKFCIPYEGNEHLLGTTDNFE